jgi:hypothetical protein
MTRGPWKYQKSHAHHHVLMGDEVLDVNSELDARAIALLPEMVAIIRELSESQYDAGHLIGPAQDVVKKLRKK